jgi:hypothetical protein
MLVSSLQPWSWRRYVSPKYLLTFTGLHSSISQKAELVGLEALTCVTLILLDVTYERSYPKFRRIVVPPTSGLECKLNKQPVRSTQYGEFFVASFLVMVTLLTLQSWRTRQCILLQHRYISTRLHDITFQKLDTSLHCMSIGSEYFTDSWKTHTESEEQIHLKACGFFPADTASLSTESW